MSVPDLARFLSAQAPVVAGVEAELAAGHKRSHWMWFIFPQLAALGRSPTARHYGIADVTEARAYLAHPILGPRLRHLVALVTKVKGRTAHDIFHSPDDLKFRSCLTLFQAISGEPVFAEALAKFYQGMPDQLTLDLLAA